MKSSIETRDLCSIKTVDKYLNLSWEILAFFISQTEESFDRYKYEKRRNNKTSNINKNILIGIGITLALSSFLINQQIDLGDLVEHKISVNATIRLFIGIFIICFVGKQNKFEENFSHNFYTKAVKCKLKADSIYERLKIRADSIFDAFDVNSQTYLDKKTSKFVKKNYLKLRKLYTNYMTEKTQNENIN